MDNLHYFLIIVIAILSITSIFLAKDFLKKMIFITQFSELDRVVIYLSQRGPYPRKPGMYNIVLRGQKPFQSLIGLKLSLLGFSIFCPFGFVQSDKKNRVVIRIYISRGKSTFWFLLNEKKKWSNVEVSSSDEDQDLKPDFTQSPHWWQRLNFCS